MKIWKIILSTLVIFIAGIFTGAMLVTNGMKLVSNSRQKPLPPKENGMGNNGNFTSGNPGMPNAQQMNPWQARMKDFVRKLDRDLDITPEQHKRIEMLVNHSQERTRDLWRPIVPAMNKEFQILRSEIRDELTPEQKEQFDKLLKPRIGGEKRRMLNQGTNFEMGTKPADGEDPAPVISPDKN